MNKTLIALAIVAVTSVAHAQQAPFYIGASFGQATADLNNVENDLASDLRAIGLTNVQVSSDDTDTAWKIFAGWQANPYLALETGYVDFGKANISASGTALNTRVNASGTFDASAWYFDAIGHLPIGEAFSIFGKAGIAYTWTDATASASGGGVTASSSASENGFAPKLGIGARYNFSKNLGVRAEYEYYFNVGDSATTGETDIGMWSVGLTAHF